MLYQRRDALADFYATLSDEQKAQFEAIGQKRMVRGA
jgi:LTXXQ motif family protein